MPNAGEIVRASHLLASADIITAASNLDLALTTSTVDIPAATVTFSTDNDNAVVLVVGFFDFDCSAFTSGGVAVGALDVDGVVQNGLAALEISATTDRATVGQCWEVTLASAGSHTIKLGARKTGGTNTISALATQTKFVGLVIDVP